MISIKTFLIFFTAVLIIASRLQATEPQGIKESATDQGSDVGQQPGPESQLSQAMPELVGELPSCSLLRQQLASGRHAAGIVEPYMEIMRRAGVKRAEFTVYSHWDGAKARDPVVVRRLYFNSYDGP